MRLPVELTAAAPGMGKVIHHPCRIPVVVGRSLTRLPFPHFHRPNQQKKKNTMITLCLQR